MKVTVDLEKCMKSGQCQYLHPELFGTDDESFPVILVDQLDEQQLEGAKEAEEICPAMAITVVEDGDAG